MELTRIKKESQLRLENLRTRLRQEKERKKKQKTNGRVKKDKSDLIWN
jgi:hypothetical protein